MLLYYLLTVNIISFVVMFIDKKLAIKGRRRLSESFIFMNAFLGGSLGVLSGMYLFRHKTKKYKFFLGIPVLIFLQSILLFYLKTIITG